MRTKLQDRILPNYSKNEEIFNMVSHILGGALGIVGMVLCIIKSALSGNVWGVVASSIYGFSLITLYCMSSIYHGLRYSTSKKVFQVLDHCAIYLLIAGSYTPIALSALRPEYPVLCWIVFGLVWGLTILSVTLTAIDIKQYRIFSMTCYIVMGWCVLGFMGQVKAVLGNTGLLLLLLGGIAYTVGAILYGVGKKHTIMHSIFHIFVLLGSVLQFFSIYLYAL